MPDFVPPYTVTVTGTAAGFAQCSYVDGNNQPVLPAGTPLTTTTPSGEPGELTINFVETQVGGENLRLVGAAVKTVGNDPTMKGHNYLEASRAQQAGDTWLDSVTVPWGPGQYTTRGVVLLFAQVTEAGDMVNFYASVDPQTHNTETSC